jgi:hypothetical protein
MNRTSILFFPASQVDAVIYCLCEGVFFELRCYYISLLGDQKRVR